MFFTRKDGAVKAQMKRRVKSPRASVYLEYAIIMPLVVMLISALIEFTSLWDAKIMANHAAWTVGRIATVRPKMTFSEKLSEKLDSGVTDEKMSAYMKAMLAPLDAVMKGANRFNNCGNVATMFLMSTCSNGYWGKSVSGDIKAMLEKMFQDPLKLIKENLTNWMTEAITKALDKFLPDSIAGPVGKLVIGILKDVIENLIFKPLTTLITKVVDVLFPSGIFDWIQNLLEKDRTVRGIFYAASRLAKNDVLTVEKMTKSPFAFSSNIDGFGTGRRLSFPRCLDKDITIRDKINQVEKDSSWPPNKQLQPMYRVKVAWPFERTWLFPIVSGYESTPNEKGLAKPTAVGWSLVYSQPDIANTNLLAEGAEVFADGTQTNQFADVLREVKAEIEGFMKTAAFGMRYRLQQEKVRPYDSDDKWSWSHKGLGNGNGDDGLVFWMGRGPKPPPNMSKDYRRGKWYDEWTKRDNACPSYKKSWFVRSNGNKKDDVLFGGVGRGLYDNLKNETSTTNTLWWFWTKEHDPSDSEFHRRYKTTKKEEVQGDWHNRKMTDFKHFNYVTRWADYYDTFLSEESKKMVPKVMEWGEYVNGWHLDQKVPYEVYKPIAERIPMSLPAWLDVYKTEDKISIAREEAYTYTNRVLCARFEKILTLVADCAKELENLNAGEQSEDADGQLDWGTSEEEMWKDPKKAAEKIRKKFDQIKTDNFKLLKEIDDAIDDIYNNWQKALDDVYEACRWRRRMFEQFHRDLVDAIVETQMPIVMSVDLREVKDCLRRKRQPSRDEAERTFKIAEASVKRVAAALERAWRAEVAYGTLFGLKAAKKHGDKSLDDLDPGKGDDPFDPRIPPESGPETGTDDDWGGESWTRGKPGEGWRQ